MFIKIQVYKVTSEGKSGGDECTYNGETVKDGDIEYDYCFGSNMERCGTETNVCACDLEKFRREM